MAIAIVEDLWGRIRAALHDEITAAGNARQGAEAARDAAEAAASQISDATATGRAVLTASSAAAARSAIGAAPADHLHPEYATTTSVNTLSARVDGRPAIFSGAGAPPSSIPHARVGDWWLNESTMELHKITAL